MNGHSSISARQTGPNIAFVVPRKTSVVDCEGRPVQRLRSNVSLSALTILGAIEDAGFGSDYLDASAEGLDEIQMIDKQTLAYGLLPAATAQYVAEGKPRFVLVTSMFTFEQQMVNEIIGEVKAILPGVSVILGGVHASVKPEWHFEESSPDFIVCGEGEDAVIELLKELASANPDPRKVHGIAFRRNDGRIEKTPPRRRLERLDRPWALRKVLRQEDGRVRYTDKMCRKHPAYVSERAGEDVGVFSFYGSRGCRCRCDYCPTTARDGANPRHMSAEFMFAQFLIARKEYNVHVFANQADNFGVQPDGVEFLRKVLDYRKTSGDLDFLLNNPNAFFLQQFFPPSNGYSLDIGFIDLLQGAGFNAITVAIESLSQRFNRKIDWKRIRPDDVVALCDEIRRRGMKSDIYMMFGFPGQTTEEFDRDVAFGERLLAHADVVSWNGVTLLPGTKYYEKYVDTSAKETEYRRIMRSGYAWHLPIEKFNLSRVPTERFRSALAPFGRSWL